MIFCLIGIFNCRIVGIGSRIMAPSVTMLMTACAMAMLFKHVPLPVARGLQGPEKSAVNTIVEATRANATMYRQMRKLSAGLMRW